MGGLVEIGEMRDRSGTGYDLGWIAGGRGRIRRAIRGMVKEVVRAAGCGDVVKCF